MQLLYNSVTNNVSFLGETLKEMSVSLVPTQHWIRRDLLHQGIPLVFTLLEIRPIIPILTEIQTFSATEKWRETFHAHSIMKELLVVKMSPHIISADPVTRQDGIR